MRWPCGVQIAFEVSLLHPDEAPGYGSAQRAEEERRARLDPTSITSTWVRIEFMHALGRRIEEKVLKAPGYTLAGAETLSLLVPACVATPSTLAATFVFAHLVDLAALNAQFNGLLESSRFESAYLHLQVGGNAVFEWRRSNGWKMRRAPDDIRQEDREILAMLKEHGGFRPNGRLPNTRILGRWP